MIEHKFNSISELTEHLKISRTALYRRANLSDINLTGVYSDEQLFEQQIKFLNKEISAKDKQIKLLSGQLKENDLQISLLHKYLDQAQQLQLIAEQRLTETKDTLIKYQEKENHTKKDSGVRFLNNCTF